MAAGGGLNDMSAPAAPLLSPWREAFARFAAPLSDADRRVRGDEFARFAARGFPTTRLEDWKYTDVSTLAERGFDVAASSATAPDLSAYLLGGCDHLVLVDGHVRTGADPVPAAPLPAPTETSDAIVSLNRAFATGGAVVSLAAGERRPRPLQILVVTTRAAEGRMTHLAHRLVLGQGATADVLLEHVDLGTTTHFTTQTLDIRLARGAQLRLTRLQREGAGTTHLFRGAAALGEASSLEVCNIDLGGGLVRNDWVAELVERDASVRLDGVYAPKGSTHVDNHTRIDHRAPHCQSREFFRGLALDTAHAVFNGKIVVHPGAQKTDSEQRVANLILSPKAEVNAKPELEIYADDVKCAHGATFGQLDRTALFYLRSRGLSLEQARGLLTLAFAREPVRRIADTTIRRHADSHVARQVGGDAHDPSLDETIE